MPTLLTHEAMYGWIQDCLNFRLLKDKSLTEEEIAQIENVLDLVDQVLLG